MKPIKPSKKADWGEELYDVILLIHKHIMDPEEIDKILRPFISQLLDRHCRERVEEAKKEITDEIIGAWAELTGYVWGTNMVYPWPDKSMKLFNRKSVKLRDKTIEIILSKLTKGVRE